MKSVYIISAAVAVSLIAVLLAAVALGAVPAEFERLLAAKGPEVADVIEEPTLYRVAELDGLPCSAEAFEFLIDRPRISMVLAHAIDPSMDEYDIKEMPDGSFHVDDGDRLVGDMELVDGGRGRRVYYMSGCWKFVLGITFEGRMVLVPEYSEVVEGGRRSVNTKTRGYMKVDNALVGAMARMVAYVFPGKVDARINRFAGSVRKVAEAVRDDPTGLYCTLLATGKVTPAEAGEFRVMFMRGRSGGGK